MREVKKEKKHTWMQFDRILLFLYTSINEMTFHHPVKPIHNTNHKMMNTEQQKKEERRKK